jgi:hypothetical protein
VPLLVWAAALWPAVMVADSMDTWNQAAEGPVVAWHPPAYTYLQRLVHWVMVSPSGVILLQCAAMALAIRLVLDVAVEAGVKRRWAYGFGFVIAWLPPVGAFTSHLIKDVPFAIGFLLALSVVARDAIRRAGFRVPTARAGHPEITLFFGLALLALTRVNGLLVLAGIGVAAIAVARRRLVTTGTVASVVVTFYVLTGVIYPALDVRPPPNYLRTGVTVFDLGALYQHDPAAVPIEARDDLELYASQQEWEQGFNCHWGGQDFQNRFYIPQPTISVDDLQGAWKEALLDEPFFLIGNHLCAAAPAWNPLPTPEELDYRQTVWDVVVANPQGVVADPISDRLGARARELLRNVGYGTVSQVLFWRAPTWMYAVTLLLAIGVVRHRRWVVLWMLVPFAAQTASVIAMVGPHYRYMAPAWIGAVLLLPLAWRIAVGRPAPRPDEPDGSDASDAPDAPDGERQPDADEVRLVPTT